MEKSDYQQFNKIINDAKNIVILQADNPDGDSLASSLALEEILSDMGKKVSLVCGIDMPAHLKYLGGWSRVDKELPNSFDATIIVDANSVGLFEILQKNGHLKWISTKPLIVLDHHVESDGIPFSNLTIVDKVVATGELIYNIASALDLPLSLNAKEMITVSILSDSLGLTSDGTTSSTIRTIADLVDGGVSIPKLELARRELMRKEPELLHYKGRLLERVEFTEGTRIAMVTIPWAEIEKYSSAYNPSMLVIDDMRMVVGTDVAIAFKLYPDGKITAKIRCNFGYGVAADLASTFGGGGHIYASGFKVTDGTKLNILKQRVSDKAIELLKELDIKKND